MSDIVLSIESSCCCSVAKLCLTLQSHGLQASSSCTVSGVCSNSCPVIWWCYLNISSFAALFSYCLQSFPGSGSFPMSFLFVSGGQSIGISASLSALNIQGWFPLGLIGWSPCSPKDFRVFSIPTVQKHQFFIPQTPLWSNSHICTWLLEKPEVWLERSLPEKWYLCFFFFFLHVKAMDLFIYLFIFSNFILFLNFT